MPNNDGRIFWKARPLRYFSDGKQSAHHNQVAWNAKHAGTPALNSKMKTSHLRGSIFGSLILSHVVVWALHHGKWPDHDIDHIDGDPTNNAPSNLLKTTKAKNGKNCQISRSNTSGVTGVSYYKIRDCWMAYITINGKRKTIGYFTELDDAAEARKRAEIDAGFSQNHGRRRFSNGRVKK